MTGTRASNMLQSAPQRYELFLFRLSRDIKEDSMKDFLNEEQIDTVDIETDYIISRIMS